jgi:hypothetical protein
LTAPLFVGAGENDRDVPVTRQLKLVTTACAAGTVVEAHVYRGLDHVQPVEASLKDAIPLHARHWLANQSLRSVSLRPNDKEDGVNKQRSVRERSAQPPTTVIGRRKRPF